MKCFAPNLLPRKTGSRNEKTSKKERGVGDRAHPEEDMIEDWLSNSDLYRTRWTHEESEDKDCYINL